MKKLFFLCSAVGITILFAGCQMPTTQNVATYWPWEDTRVTVPAESKVISVQDHQSSTIQEQALVWTGAVAQ